MKTASRGVANLRTRFPFVLRFLCRVSIRVRPWQVSLSSPASLASLSSLPSLACHGRTPACPQKLATRLNGCYEVSRGGRRSKGSAMDPKDARDARHARHARHARDAGERGMQDEGEPMRGMKGMKVIKGIKQIKGMKGMHLQGTGDRDAEDARDAVDARDQTKCRLALPDISHLRLGFRANARRRKRGRSSRRR